MASEVIRCESYIEKCDVYSFGVILNELLTGNYLYVETKYGPTKVYMIITLILSCLVNFVTYTISKNINQLTIGENLDTVP